MNLTRLEKILADADVKACVKFFAKLSERERKAIAKDVNALIKPIFDRPDVTAQDDCWELAKSRDPSGFSMNGTIHRDNPRTQTAEVALLATGSFSQIKRRWRRSWTPYPDDAIVFDFLSACQPEWLNEWVVWVLQTNRSRWRLVRRLVRAGICQEPDTPDYTRGMVRHLVNYRDEAATAYLELNADRDLLRAAVWRIFEVEDTSFALLPSPGAFGIGAHERGWSEALLRLSHEKKLSRDRLLDASLESLSRGFGHIQAGGFSRFHEALEPTIDERAARTREYLALLSSRVSSTVAFAVEAIFTLAKEDRVEPAAVLAAISPALSGRPKATAERALAILELLAQRRPRSRSAIMLAATEAFLHSRAEVHKLATDLLLSAADSLDAQTIARIRECIEQIAPSQRNRLQAILQHDSSAKSAVEIHPANPHDETALRRAAAALPERLRRLAGVDEALNSLNHSRDPFEPISGVDFDPTAVPRLDRSRIITPIETVDELIDAATRAVENAGDIEGRERVYDAVSRLCDVRDDDFAQRTGPLAKRARQLKDPVLTAWLASEAKPTKILGPWKEAGDQLEIECEYRGHRFSVPRSKQDLFPVLRLERLAERCAAGVAAPLLAAPTHSGGWIDPEELVRRALVRQAIAWPDDRFDQVQSLLRMAPDGRKPALRAAKRVAGEFGEALRYALGGDERIGADAALWIAAARARNPFGDDPKLEAVHPQMGPNAAHAVQFGVSIEPIPNDFQRKKRIVVESVPPSLIGLAVECIPVHLTASPRRNDWFYYERYLAKDCLRPIMAIWPIQREAWFGTYARSFADHLDWYTKAWGLTVVLEPLLDPDVPLGPMARLVLALGMAAKEPGQSGLATDALIAAIDDGRFDPARFGETLATVLPMLNAGRLARTCAHAARISPLHRQQTIRGLEAALRGDPNDAPRDFSALLEFLKEALIDSDAAIESPAALAYLEKLPSGGKTARLARELLGLQASPHRDVQIQLRLQSLKSRIERAERWATVEKNSH